MRSLSTRYLAIVFVVSRARRVSRIYLAFLGDSVPLSTAFCNQVTTQRACSFLNSLPNVRLKSHSGCHVTKLSTASWYGFVPR